MSSELIVLSHLRWSWVWQRPQHLIARIGAGRTVWFVEEPATPEGAVPPEPRLRAEDAGAVTTVRLEIPGRGRHVGFEDDVLPYYVDQLPALVGPPQGERIVWLYSPLALEVALALEPTTLVYDVMDDLASFKDAAPELVVRQRQTLRRADVVFAGGRSLYRSVEQQGRDDVHLFPSGVEPEHYAQARSYDVSSQRPVAGYVGVIDERLDLELLAGLAAELPDWEIRMVGPLAKLTPEDLPQAPNLVYVGPKPYAELPQVMAGFDVALMPFALNDATRSISPTKTLEYLAAGLPVVSTRVPDVVTDFSSCVDLQDDARGFAAACVRVRGHDLSDRDAKLRPLLVENHWDTIARRMGNLIDASAAARDADDVDAEEVSA
jgi:glycosyltransferase involved in cell wall biosynthesis